MSLVSICGNMDVCERTNADARFTLWNRKRTATSFVPFFVIYFFSRLRVSGV
jgi:hypothetical protein